MWTSPPRSISAFVGFMLCTALWGQNGPVTPTGAMRNTLFNGQLAGLIAMDGLAVPGTYGIGPVEYLRGELLVLDGHVFVSTAAKEGGMTVEQRPTVRAPFFVHQRVEHWTSVELPDSIDNLAKLDAFLSARYADAGSPFAFRMHGDFAAVDAHIMDVPMGNEVNGPDDAHLHSKDYHTEGRNMDIVGFFSTKHKAVFTHHDTNIHVHAITRERDWMGHVEGMRFAPADVQLHIAEPAH